MEMKTLSVEDVLLIHDTLVGDFASTHDPIEPPGMRSEALLHSAVSRQHTGLGGALKYPSPIDNAATLTFGLCNNHPFHNGNKRTALVALLAHLDKNRFVLMDVKQKHLYDLMLSLASNSVSTTHSRGRRPRREQGGADREIRVLAEWLSRRTQKVKRGDKPLVYKQLRRALERYDCFLATPKSGSIDICKTATQRRGILLKRQAVDKRIGSIPYRGENELASVSLVKHVRSICRLTEEDGVDTEAFYGQGAVVDTFVNEYRTILRRLGKT